jgi:hypothetical protein
MPWERNFGLPLITPDPFLLTGKSTFDGLKVYVDRVLNFLRIPPCHGNGDGNPLFKAGVKHKVIPLRESFLGEIETPEAISGVG